MSVITVCVTRFCRWTSLYEPFWRVGTAHVFRPAIRFPVRRVLRIFCPAVVKSKERFLRRRTVVDFETVRGINWRDDGQSRRYVRLRCRLMWSYVNHVYAWSNQILKLARELSLCVCAGDFCDDSLRFSSLLIKRRCFLSFGIVVKILELQRRTNFALNLML